MGPRLTSLTFIWLVFAFPGFAQTAPKSAGWILHCAPVEQESKLVLSKRKYQQHVADSVTAVAEALRVVELLRKEGYLAAAADQFTRQGDSLVAWIYTGAPYVLQLMKGNLPEEMMRLAGRRQTNSDDWKLSYRRWTEVSEKILSYTENQGYPFASISLDSSGLSGQVLSARINYQSGPLVRFDSLSLTGSAKVRKSFLYTYLGIKPGQLFSQRKVDEAGYLLSQLAFIRMSSPLEAKFSDNKAYLNIRAEHRRTNQFDGIIGFVPNQAASNKMMVTGDVKLRINNLFGTGKSFRLQWQQVRPASPVLYLEYVHPVLFGTRLEAKANLDLLKQDSTFLTVNRRLMFTYPVSKGTKVYLSAGVKTSRLSTAGQYENATTLPPLADSNYPSYGLGFEWSKLDDYFAPKRGFKLFGQGEVGNKKIIKNPFVDQQLYNGIQLNEGQVSLQAGGQKYVSLSSKTVLFLQAQAAKLFCKNLFYNDLFRLGGLSTIRGFNENYFFASAYALSRVEYRFYTDPGTYLLFCYDQAWLSTQTVQGSSKDAPSGLGMGINFLTRSGNFNLVYSLGNSANQKFSLNNSKIHFGFVSTF